MNWQKKTILSPKPTYKGQLKFSSPPLTRFIGSTGFISSGLGTFYLMQYVIGVDPDIWHSSNWDIKTVVLLVVSVIAGVLGGLFSAFLGVTIQVKSERVNHSLSVLWHYLASGTIIWFFLLALCLNKIYGKNKIKVFINFVGEWNFTFYTVSIVTLGTLLIGLILLMTGAMKEYTKPNFFICLVLSLPITLTMGYVQYYSLGVNSKLWIFMGIALSVALHPVSIYLINRDKEQRRQILEI
ncbi:hypothetical protein HY990_00295 [Candidatus Micrarchaeota archaeon]|nr:hypothetical protein [Candidatus Micrarchaeota archaeon]